MTMYQYICAFQHTEREGVSMKKVISLLLALVMALSLLPTAVWAEGEAAAAPAEEVSEGFFDSSKITIDITFITILIIRTIIQCNRR